MTDERPLPAGEAEGEQELLRSSQVFLTELDRLAELEGRKRDMSPDDERRVPLAHEIEDATIGLISLSRYQTRLIKLEQQSRATAPPSDRTPQVILAEWRAAERRLHEARSAMERAGDEADRLRDEHRHTLRDGPG